MEEGDVDTEAEVEVMWPQVRNTWIPQGLEEAGGVLPQSLRRATGLADMTP